MILNLGSDGYSRKHLVIRESMKASSRYWKREKESRRGRRREVSRDLERLYENQKLSNFGPQVIKNRQ
jgi:hypothetical protein